MLATFPLPGISTDLMFVGTCTSDIAFSGTRIEQLCYPARKQCWTAVPDTLPAHARIRGTPGRDVTQSTRLFVLQTTSVRPDVYLLSAKIEG